MAIKRIGKNISVDPELLEQFDKDVQADHQNRSRVLQECMRAYHELTERCRVAGIKRLPRLEFKGCEPSDRIASPSPARSWPVSGRALKCKTGRIEHAK